MAKRLAARGAVGTGIVKVEGLDEFRRELRRLGPEYADDMKDLNHKVGQLIVDRTKAKARMYRGNSQGSGRNLAVLARRAFDNAKASRKQRESSVRIGGARRPYAVGLEFGAKKYRQFPPWRGNQWPSTWVPEGVGYVIHPVIRESRQEILDIYGDGLEHVARKAFPDRG